MKLELKQLDYSSYLNTVNDAYKKYINKTKIKNKLDFNSYLIKHKILTRNKKAGEIAEEIVNQFLKGKNDPKKAIFIPPNKRRFPDNFYKNTLKEVKSGKVTMKYKDQIDKDIEILLRKLKFKGKVKKIERNAINGVDEIVLKYIKNQMNKTPFKPVDKYFQIILY